MNFPSIKKVKIYKTLIHTNLFMIEYGQTNILFTLFNISHQGIIKQSHLFISDLQDKNEQGIDISLYGLFLDLQKNPQEIISFSNNHMIIKLRLPKIQTPMIFNLQFDLINLTSDQTILYIKQYINSKEDFYKNEILKLKTKIYSLMTQVEDANTLIKSQSCQAKNSKQQVKILKKQLQILQEEKKKQQQTYMIEVGVQHSYSTQINDIIECLKKPELKNYTFDEEKLQKLTQFIQQQIKESQNIFKLATEAMHKKQHEDKKCSSEPKIPFENEQHEIPRVSFSPQKVYLFDKVNNNLTIENYSLKTLQSI